MSERITQRNMLIQVATALGEDLLRDVAFVGGCTTALFLTDEVTLEDIRATTDVDLTDSAEFSFQTTEPKRGGWWIARHRKMPIVARQEGS